MALGLPLGDSTITHWLEPVFEEAEVILALEHEPYALFGIDGWLILASVTVAAIGLVLAWRYFGVEIGPLNVLAWPERVRELSARPGLSFLYRASLNKWWFDELNHLLFMVIGGRIAQAIWWFDREVVDGTVNAIGSSTVGAGRGLRLVQTGRVQNYALGIALGLLVMAGSYLILAGSSG
jgi:NADH:ubiquinone oxidoreductase subunit 5 (subunit L)/multisubunit Na+/H+ antiporter MnhA subunit